MPRTPNTERLEKLKQQAARIDQQIRAIAAADKKKVRSDDARRKIIAGALALEHAEANPKSEFSRVLTGLLDEYTRDNERYLFPALPPRSASPEPTPSPALSVEADAAE
jgi:septal ring factor EnvC (AmiA/AmiB activator)